MSISGCREQASMTVLYLHTRENYGKSIQIGQYTHTDTHTHTHTHAQTQTHTNTHTHTHRDKYTITHSTLFFHFSPPEGYDLPFSKLFTFVFLREADSLLALEL